MDNQKLEALLAKYPELKEALELKDEMTGEPQRTDEEIQRITEENVAAAEAIYGQERDNQPVDSELIKKELTLFESYRAGNLTFDELEKKLAELEK
ncbi:MAG: hypothetical protein WA057_02770 [Candidatus Magasanikiibacteriota bacterium]